MRNRKIFLGEVIRDRSSGAKIEAKECAKPFTRVAWGYARRTTNGEGENFRERTSVSSVRKLLITAQG